MSTVLDEPAHQNTTTAVQRLRTTMAAVRVSLSWFGTRKTLTAEQKAEAAEPFGTDARFLSAGKRLLDTSHPAYKAVTAVRGKVVAYWKSMSSAVPGAGHPAHPAGQDRRLRRQDAGVPGGVGRGRRNPGPALQRTEGHGPAASRIAVQRRRLSRFAAGHVLRRVRFSLAWNRRTIFSNSTRSSTRKSAGGCSPVSTRPCDWPRRRSPPNWPSWSAI